MHSRAGLRKSFRGWSRGAAPTRQWARGGREGRPLPPSSPTPLPGPGAGSGGRDDVAATGDAAHVLAGAGAGRRGRRRRGGQRPAAQRGALPHGEPRAAAPQAGDRDAAPTAAAKPLPAADGATVIAADLARREAGAGGSVSGGVLVHGISRGAHPPHGRARGLAVQAGARRALHACAFERRGRDGGGFAHGRSLSEFLSGRRGRSCKRRNRGDRIARPRLSDAPGFIPVPAGARLLLGGAADPQKLPGARASVPGTTHALGDQGGVEVAGSAARAATCLTCAALFVYTAHWRTRWGADRTGWRACGHTCGPAWRPDSGQSDQVAHPNARIPDCRGGGIH